MAASQACYLQLVMRYIVLGSDGKINPTIKYLWKEHNIKLAIDNTAAAWNKAIKKHEWYWRPLLLKCVHDILGFDNAEGI
jgi:hypothetical protein